MIRDSGQFGSWDGADNRKELMILFGRLGKGLTEEDARKKRAAFLQSLIGDSTNGFDGKPMTVTPCSTVEAYHLAVAITGALGVDINVAAQKLVKAVGGR